MGGLPPAALDKVAGTYSGSQKSASHPARRERLTLVVAADGGLTGGTEGACGITGDVAPTTTGSTYRINLHYGSACPCLSEQDFSGVVLLDPSGIIGLASNGARDSGVILEADRLG